VPISFNIAQWHAWAPGITDAESWQAWARTPYVPADLGQQPDVSFVPAMQRRRLTRLARMSFAAAWPLAQDKTQNNTQVPMIFGSRHGETPVTFSLLQSLAQHEALSPTQFGLSVHNAVAGQWSIQRADTAETCAVAADADILEHTIVEACGLLHEGAPAVIAILAEDAPADFYRDQIDDIPFPFAVALRLTAGTDWTLSSAAAHAAEPTPGLTPTPAFGHVLPWLRAMLQGAPTWTHDCPPRSWTWQRQC